MINMSRSRDIEEHWKLKTGQLTENGMINDASFEDGHMMTIHKMDVSVLAHRNGCPVQTSLNPTKMVS